MKSIKLMNRIDTKFVAPASALSTILQMADVNYRIQTIEQEAVLGYDTLYFDTPNCEMYLKHHNRKLKRQKVRTRTYLQSGLTFLEIKSKSNRGRTHKERVKIERSEFFTFQENSAAQLLMADICSYKASELQPTLSTRFKRITLVNRAKTERLTIDFDLSFENYITGLMVAQPNLLIIELKQDGLAHSDMKDILTKLRIKQFKISKYCIGTAMTNRNIKQNRFKLKLNKLNKITTI